MARGQFEQTQQISGTSQNIAWRNALADQVWQLIEGDGPIVAAAIHDGHDLRQEVAARMEIVIQNSDTQGAE